jgi:hypothetical protein
MLVQPILNNIFTDILGLLGNFLPCIAYGRAQHRLSGQDHDISNCNLSVSTSLKRFHNTYILVLYMVYFASMWFISLSTVCLKTQDQRETRHGGKLLCRLYPIMVLSPMQSDSAM